MRQRSYSLNTRDPLEFQEIVSTSNDVTSPVKQISPKSPTRAFQDAMGSQSNNGRYRRETSAWILAGDLREDAEDSESVSSVTVWQLFGLYTSHTLSMWNSRSYEYASVLFTASAYPDTLTVASLRGLSANLAAFLLSPALGRWCNKHPSRLRTLQLCIAVQRLCICLACLGWLLIVQPHGVDREHSEHDDSNITQDFTMSPWVKHTTLALLLLLGMLEKLSAVGNLIVMERDWLPLLASPTSKPALHILNASIKRIDLVCKLVAPLAISAFALGVDSLWWTALLIAGMQGLSVVPEMVTAKHVWSSSPLLQGPHQRLGANTVVEHAEIREGFQSKKLESQQLLTQSARTLWLYMTSSVCLPSLAYALQPFSVLTLSASMTVYLLTAKFPLTLITSARTLSTIIEIASTVATPLLVTWFRNRDGGREKDGDRLLGPLITVGQLGQCWQLSLLLPSLMALVSLPSNSGNPTAEYPVLTGTLLICLAISRLGPFAYSLVEQQLVQTLVPVDQRVEFSGVEMALVSLAEMVRWTLTGVFGRPEQFRFVAVVSFVGILTSIVLFWVWTRRQRRISTQGEYEPVPKSDGTS